MFKSDKITAILALMAVLMIGGCATLPENFERPVSHAYTETNDTSLGKLIQDEKAAHPGKSGFLLLGSGLDAFVARAVLAESAERSIDAQYYLYHDDLVGKLFTGYLVRAADRGPWFRRPDHPLPVPQYGTHRPSTVQGFAEPAGSDTYGYSWKGTR